MIDENLKTEILNRLYKNVKLNKIILFGSYASGNINENSDIDIIVILNEGGISQSFKESIERRHRISKLFLDIKQKIPMDILVYTQDEWDKAQEINNSFMRDVNEKGIILS